VTKVGHERGEGPTKKRSPSEQTKAAAEGNTLNRLAVAAGVSTLLAGSDTWPRAGNALVEFRCGGKRHDSGVSYLPARKHHDACVERNLMCQAPRGPCAKLNG
jgi:hypothetical protein